MIVALWVMWMQSAEQQPATSGYAGGVEVMVLIPKDTAALVTSMTEAVGAQLSGGENQPPKADDPNVIDLTPNKPVEPEPINDTVSAIRRFQAAQGRRA